MPEPWVPTVDDLRVKLCYICREEERHDSPPNPPVAWVHPCNCTLVAHESCLLTWIQSAQSDSSRAPNALKCPQCGAVYELESENPLPLRILNSLNAVLSASGRVVSIAGLVTVGVSFGLGVYVIFTSYGAYAIQEFLGKELFDILLSDDPSNWPWHAYLNLPLIPVSLILSRTNLLDMFPIVPLFLAWTSSPAVPTTTTALNANFRRSIRGPDDSYPFAPVIHWPPSPIMVTILFPYVSTLYRRYMMRLRHWVMGTQSRNRPPVRRIVWALNEDGPLRVHIGANIQDDDNVPRRGGDAQQQQQGQGEGQQQPQEGGQEQQGEAEPQDPAAVAERTIRVTGASLGRYIGGALMIPRISSFMGSLLLKLSRHSVLLRKFLAVRPPRTAPVEPVSRWFENQDFTKLGYLGQLGTGITLALQVVCGGTKIFADSDPVWWRNSLGLGLFVVAKDCINLLHLYLTKREIETRRVKSRSFAGVDYRELDLITPPSAQAEGAETQ
ncbi:hypothetical protein ABKN59_002979 [Abortiporus biennis]